MVQQINEQVICKGCKQKTHILDMVTYKNQYVCDGCAEGLSIDPRDDPHGKGFTDDNDYGCHY